MKRSQLLVLASMGTFLLLFLLLPYTSEAANRPSPLERMRERIASQLQSAEDRVSGLIESYCKKFQEYHDEFGTGLPSFCDDDPTPPPPTNAPTVSFSVNPSVLEEGDSASLSWSSTNATSCTASGSWTGSKNLSGSQTVSPSETATYSLACTGPDGNASHTITLPVLEDVVVPPPPSPVVLNFSAASSSIVEGTTTDLTWSSSNATSCTASNGWSGSKDLSGNQSITPQNTTSYTLTCANAATSTSKTVVVTVTDAPEPPAESGKVLLNEIYYDTDTSHGTDAQNEWIEIYNDSSNARDLTGYTIYDGNLSDAIATGTTIAAHGYLVIANASTTASFWNIPVGASVLYLENPLGNGLGNAGDALYLRNSSFQTVDAVGWGANTTVFNPGVTGGGDGISIERINHVDTDSAADWQGNVTPTPGG